MNRSVEGVGGGGGVVVKVEYKELTCVEQIQFGSQSGVHCMCLTNPRAAFIV